MKVVSKIPEAIPIRAIPTRNNFRLGDNPRKLSMRRVIMNGNYSLGFDGSCLQGTIACNSYSKGTLSGRSCPSQLPYIGKDRGGYTYETPRQTANLIWAMEKFGLPKNYMSKLLDQMARTGTDDCMKLVREAIDPDELVIVVVGDAKVLKAELEKIAPVTVVEP